MGTGMDCEPGSACPFLVPSVQPSIQTRAIPPGRSKGGCCVGCVSEHGASARRGLQAGRAENRNSDPYRSG